MLCWFCMVSPGRSREGWSLLGVDVDSSEAAAEEVAVPVAAGASPDGLSALEVAAVFEEGCAAVGESESHEEDAVVFAAGVAPVERPAPGVDNPPGLVAFTTSTGGAESKVTR